MSWPIISRAALAHGGHGNGAYATEVRVNSQAQAAYLNLTAQSSLPLGTLLVQVQRDGSGRLQSVFAMEKSASSASPWIFTRLTSEGRVEQSGALPGCARCHAEGLGDSLFGPARAP
jgi:hypothetical protein